ncbi:hypothetical protein KC19_2G189200 [Ceratodon purpureus]|uniref:Uncharacterized protein n=1 Tax=Ceratodon purpureus TaxID=3225 RepID=A0A8T0IYB6_CERPU|nr:hypothetical protein KC19_2G189200 [Ceratodon purpureus]
MLLNDGYDVWIGHQRATYWSHGHVHLNSTDRQEYYETGFQNGMFNYSTEFSETGPYSAQGLSNTAIALISGPNCCLGSAPIRFVNGWDGTTSYKNLLQWQQGIRTNNFAYYDYGSSARNMQAYGRPTPPVYNVGRIPRRMPILIIAGGRDWYSPSQGIRLLLSQLQQQAILINLTNYAHYDLEFSVRRETDMYVPILRYLGGPRFH